MQINYFIWKRDNIKTVKGCKVIPGESVISQHRIIIMVLWCSGKKVSKINKKLKNEKELSIWWSKL